MKINNCASCQRGLSFPIILISGIIAAFFLVVGVLVIQYMMRSWSPTKKNINLLIEKRKYRQALSLIDEKGSTLKDSSELLLMQGKVWLAVMIRRVALIAWPVSRSKRWATQQSHRSPGAQRLDSPRQGIAHPDPNRGPANN